MYQDLFCLFLFCNSVVSVYINSTVSIDCGEMSCWRRLLTMLSNYTLIAHICSLTNSLGQTSSDMTAPGLWTRILPRVLTHEWPGEELLLLGVFSNDCGVLWLCTLIPSLIWAQLTTTHHWLWSKPLFSGPILIMALQQSLENYPNYVFKTEVLKLVILYQKCWFLLEIPGVLLLTFPVRKHMCATIYLRFKFHIWN